MVFYFTVLTHRDGAPGLTWEVAHFLRMSLVAPGGGVILLNSPVLSLGVGTSSVFLLFEGEGGQSSTQRAHVFPTAEGRRLSTKENLSTPSYFLSLAWSPPPPPQCR